MQNQSYSLPCHEPKILGKVLSSYGNELKAVEQQQRQTSASTETAIVTPKPTIAADLQAQKLVNYQKRDILAA